MIRNARSFMSITRGQEMASRSKIERISLMEMIVEKRAAGVMSRGHGMKIAGQVKVEIEDRFERRPAATSRTTFDPE